MLRTSSMPSRMKASVCLSEMFSLLKITERESLPLAVSKPVLSTHARQPPSGAWSVT